MSSGNDGLEPAVARLDNKYELIKIIGKGSSAKVWQARSVSDPNQQFAIKILTQNYLTMRKARENVEEEVEIMKALSH